MLINPLAPTLGGFLKIGDTPKTPAERNLLHLFLMSYLVGLL
jgi:hypothetical protein